MGLYNQALNENIDNLQVNNNVGKGGGSWAELQGKPFETIGDGLVVFNNQLVAHGYHDYSEDEQIIGTWFGKTLYEKTITFSAVNSGGWIGPIKLGSIHLVSFKPESFIREIYHDSSWYRNYSVYDNEFHVRLKGVDSIQDGKVTIQYTKN